MSEQYIERLILTALSIVYGRCCDSVVNSMDIFERMEFAHGMIHAKHGGAVADAIWACTKARM